VCKLCRGNGRHIRPGTVRGGDVSSEGPLSHDRATVPQRTPAGSVPALPVAAGVAVAAQMKLKAGTSEPMPLKSSPLAAISSSGDQAASRVTWPAALKALMA